MNQIYQPIVPEDGICRTPKQWLDIVAQFGCVVSGESIIQIHHVFGRTYKHNKVLIGPWYVLPLAFRYHDVSSDNPFNVTHYPKQFAIEKGYQRDLFGKMVNKLQEHGYPVPPPDVLKAIEESPLR